MATGPIVTEHCLLCGRELPRGGYSSRVAVVLLSPLCSDCERRCTTNPDSVVAEHHRLFEGREAKETYVPDTSSLMEGGILLPIKTRVPGTEYTAADTKGGQPCPDGNGRPKPKR